MPARDGQQGVHMDLLTLLEGPSRMLITYAVRLIAAVAMASAVAMNARAQEVPSASGSPLELSEVIREARANRGEIAAARARAEALAERPAIVGALEDPMISPSVDHYPFRMMDEEDGRRYDWSIAVEQRFPLSGVRSQRRRVARADAARAAALAEQVLLDVVLDAQQAFFMLRERRRMAAVLEQQLRLGRELVSAAAARYAGGTGVQADVLRAEVETARIEAAQRSLAAQTRAAEAMLNASMGRATGIPIGELEYGAPDREPPPVERLQDLAARSRPELRAGEAEVQRSAAEIEVMRSMYRPMATVRAGRASTMAEGAGAMLMIGVSVPLWRSALRAGVSEARAMERMANADLNAMQRMIEGEIASARAEVESTRETRRSLETDIIPRAQMAVNAALSAYGAGQSTLVSVVEASRALWDARSELLMAETATSLAWARLDRAAGENAANRIAP
jgi:outer membrane protein, heavy metal efflux system